MQTPLGFQKNWQPTKAILNEISSQVINHYKVKDQIEVFTLKGSVLPAYTNVFNYCTSKPSYKDRIFQKFKEALIEFIADNFVTSSDGPIHNFNKLFNTYSNYMITISKRIFAYLDRYFTPAMEECNLKRIGLNLFRQILFQKGRKQGYFNSWIEMLGQIRQKKIIQHRQLMKFSQSLIVIDQINLLKPLIEIFLKETTLYYQHFYQMHKDDTPLQYLTNVKNLQYFQQKLLITTICLNPSELNEVHSIFDKIIIQQYTPTVLNNEKGIRNFLNKKDISSLKVIWQIYTQFEGFEKIRGGIYDFIIGKGQLLIEQMKQDKQVDRISKLYNFIKEWRSIIQEGFEDKGEIVVSFKNALQQTASKCQNIAKQLAVYIRQKLDKGELQIYKQVIKSVFEILPSKDEFLHLHECSIDRKILDDSFIYLIEKGLVNQLKQMCGNNQIVQNMDKKIEDYVKSLTVICEFNMFNPKFVVHNIKVLSYQLWQKKFEDQITLNMTLIQPFQKIWNHFENFFAERQDKKKLIILPFDTKITFAIRFKSQWVNIKCNLIQANIITYITQQTYRTDQQIILNLMIQKNLFTKCLEPLPPFIKQISSGIYSIDWQYQSSSLIDLDSKTEQSITIPKGIKQDRDKLIEASIVKCLKQRKQLGFEEVVEQVTKRIKLFKPHPSNIKVGLAQLVKNYFIQENNGIFKYLE